MRSAADIFQPILTAPDLAAAAAAAKDALFRAHRHPAVLRHPDAITAESLTHAAAASHRIPGNQLELSAHVTTYAQLIDPATGSIDQALTKASLTRPGYVLARLDRAAGGDGTPHSESFSLDTLNLLNDGSLPPLISSALSHGILVATNPCGHRTPLVARVYSRAQLIATGMDPIGMAVPEKYFATTAGYDAETFMTEKTAAQRFILYYLAALSDGADYGRTLADQVRARS